MPRGGYRDETVTEFWLTEHQALAVLLQLRTPQARQARAAVVKAFVAFRRGQLSAIPAPQQVPVLSSSPLVGDSHLHRAEMVSWCGLAARNNNVSVHRIHGALRRQCGVPSVYRIPLVLFPQAVELAKSLARGSLLLPAAPGGRQLKSVPDPAQHVLPFPGTQR